MNSLQQQIDACGPVVEALCTALAAEVAKLGFAADSVTVGSAAAVVYRLERDPAAGIDCLCGEWCDAQGRRVGQIRFNADGSVFAEHDVVRAHPRDGRRFVEAVQAWGRAGRISAEPRLLAMPS